MNEGERRLPLPWEESLTGMWSPKTGLYDLRDVEVDELAGRLNKIPDYVVFTGLVELTAHGMNQKAATLARALSSLNPAHETYIRATSEAFARQWFDIPLQETFDDMH